MIYYLQEEEIEIELFFFGILIKNLFFFANFKAQSSEKKSLVSGHFLRALSHNNDLRFFKLMTLSKLYFLG